MGNDSLAVGNGKGLSISHTGSSQYLANGNTASLHNILHVPNFSQNLLSVSQFTKDNDCHFVFTSTGFCVKENKTWKILFHRATSNGLYSLPMQLSTQNKSSVFPYAFNSARLSSSL